jgi:DNA-binding NarL/FixJ family response regulator
MQAFLSDSDKREPVYGAQPLQVMIVDEENTFRRKMRDILHGIGGFQVVTETASRRVALETVERMRIDLVIVELTLGNEGGAQLTRRLKQLPGSPHVIVFSPTMHDETLMQAILAGADGYIMKDTPTRDIVRAFKNFEHGGPAMLPAIITNVIHLLVERCQAAGALAAVGQEQGSLLASNLLSFHTTDTETPIARDPGLSPKLTSQEEKVFALLRRGQRNKQIAAELAISPYTVGKHVQNILRKLGVTNRTQAVAYTSFEGEWGMVQK